MGKVSIVYATKTKHSQKIASAIADAFNTKAQNVIDDPTAAEAELLFIVGGIYGGQSAPELVTYAEKLDRKKVKNVAIITSCVAKTQGQEAIRKILKGKGIPIKEELICQGSFLIFKMGHPNKRDIAQAVNFALSMSEKCSIPL